FNGLDGSSLSVGIALRWERGPLGAIRHTAAPQQDQVARPLLRHPASQVQADIAQSAGDQVGAVRLPRDGRFRWGCAAHQPRSIALALSISRLISGNCLVDIYE